MQIEIKYYPKKEKITIFNSFLIIDPRIMKIRLQSQIEFKKIDRSLKSCINEWIAHNRLYFLGLFISHTKDTDLEKNESKFRRMCYWILSRKVFKFLDKKIIRKE